MLCYFTNGEPWAQERQGPAQLHSQEQEPGLKPKSVVLKAHTFSLIGNILSDKHPQVKSSGALSPAWGEGRGAG